MRCWRHDLVVANRLRKLDEANRLAERLVQNAAAELREARLAAGLTQLDVAQALGTSRTRISRIEIARIRRVSLEYLTRHAATVGLRLSVKLYPAGGRLRDKAQVRYIARFLDRIGHTWRVGLDVPMPIPGDLRAVDIVLYGTGVIAVEVISRLRDLQAQLRSAQLKQRDLGAARLIIVVPGSLANRRALGEARATLLATFDLDTRRTLAKLRAGEDPGRDAIVVLD